MTFATCTCPDCGTPYPHHLTTCPQVSTKAPNDTPGIDQTKLDELNREVERLKAELIKIKKERAGLAAAFSLAEKGREELNSQNARLAASINETASVYGFTRPPDCLRALNDLLAPTIELLEQLTYPAVNSHDNTLVHAELIRLRAACGEK